MKMTMFKNMSQYLISQFLAKKTKQTKEEKYFEEKFNNFFLLEDYFFCYKMIDEGYKPNILKKTNSMMLF